MPSNRKVVYTCITGNYDSLREVKILAKDVDYICFTDSDELTSNTWMIRKIPNDLSHYSTVKQQRLLKILPHKYLSEYDLSLWVDSNIEIIDDLGYIFSKYDLNRNSIYINRHPTRDCIYKEHIAVLRLKKDVPEVTNEQINRYRDEGFPEHYGMVESNIILRKHNDPTCKNLMEIWAEEIKRGSHRDQLSFNYAVWKTQTKYGILHEKYARIQITDTTPFKMVRHSSNLLIAGITPEKIEEFKKHLAEAEIKAKEEERQDALKQIAESHQNNNAVPPTNPLVSIVFFTHARTKCATNCLNFLLKNLKYPKLRWIISSDKSSDEHIESLLGEFSKYGISREEVTLVSTYGSKTGLPYSMNNGLKEAFKAGNIVLRVEDDWLLWKPLYLKKYVDAFKDPNVCNIRLGALGGGNLQFSNYNSVLKKIYSSNDSAWLFNNQVALVNKAIYDKLGYYLVDCGSDKSELDFKSRYNSLTNIGKSKEFISLAPVEMRPNTLDDPSLWFIHVGRSELGHSYKEPKRYSFLYDEKAKTEKKVLKSDPTLLFKTSKKKTEEPKQEVKKTQPTSETEKTSASKVPMLSEQLKPMITKNNFEEKKQEKKNVLAQKTEQTNNKSDTSILKQKVEELTNLLKAEQNKNTILHKTVQEEKEKNIEKEKIKEQLKDKIKLLEKLSESLKKEEEELTSTKFTKTQAGQKYEIKDSDGKIAKTFFRIIIPNYNNSQFIKTCLNSILNQTFKDFFIIIVDDLSTDDSFEICKSYQAKFPSKFLCIKSPKKGYAGTARNIGMSVKLDSEYTWFLDGDDWLYSNKSLEIAYNNLKDKQYDILFFKPAYFRNGVLSAPPIRRFNFNDRDNLVSSMHRGAPFKIIKSSKVAPFLEENSRSEDVYQFALQLDAISNFHQIQQPLYVYNIYHGSTSHAVTESAKVQNIKHALRFRKELGILENQVSKPSVKLAIKRRLQEEKFMIVSLTSMPKRIKNVKEVVQSMLAQTLKPDLIVLYLNKNDFKDTPLPQELTYFANDPLNRLDIRWVDVDWSSHTKYIYAFQDFPDEVIITIDDDLVYEEHFLEYLMVEYTKNKSSKCIICHFSQEIYKDKDRFSVKDGRSSMKKSIMNRPLSGHGTLFPPRIFENTEIFNHDLAMKLTYKQDEWWIWYICFKHQIVTINTQAYNWPRYTQGPHQLKIFSQEDGLYNTVNSTNRESSIGKMIYDDLYNNKKKAQICVVMTATENMEYQYKYTTQINKRYCELHGYDFKFEISKEEGEKKHYLKRELILKYLDDYEWVLYMDVDAWFNNFDKKIEDLIAKYSSEKNNASLIVAKHNKALVKDSQLELTLINAGVLLVKNSTMGRKILDDWHYRTPFAKDWLKAITKLNDQPYLCMSIMFNPDIYKATALVEDVEMNYFTNRVPPYGKTTYILHASGVNYNEEWLKGMYTALKFTIANNKLPIEVKE